MAGSTEIGAGAGIVVGDCLLEEAIGRGGTGTVYRARQLAIDRSVAVKLVPVGADETVTVERFRREASAAGALDHPHSLPIYAAGEHDGLLYLVMRLVDGPDLSALVAREGPLSPARAVTLIGQVAGALDEAHASGLVHRDLKPANILIERRGRHDHAYLSDYGLTRGIAEPGSGSTGSWSGTPEFAAPEQLRGEPVGPGADIYALGGVLASTLGPDAPAGLGAVVARAVAPDPADRYATASEFAQAAHAVIARRRLRDPRWLGALAAAVAALIVAAVLGLGASHANVGRAPAYTFRQPAAWRVTLDGASIDGVRRTITQSPGDHAGVLINRDGPTKETVAARALATERTARKIKGYRQLTFGAARLDGHPVYEWEYRLSQLSKAERFFVFRRIGPNLYGVEGFSRSLALSRSAALLVAGTLTPR